jgi:hypothetical protein
MLAAGVRPLYDADPDPMLLNVGLPTRVLVNVALSPVAESVNANTR